MKIVEVIPGIKGEVIDTGCIIFCGQKDSSGYGRIDRIIDGKRRQFKAHRLVLEAKLGRPIKDKYCCCHVCDVRNCINPEHLWEGTVADNNRDMCRKGRAVYPENAKLTQFKVGQPSPRRSLSNEQVKLIKQKLLDGIPKKQIAREFNTDPRIIRYIASGERYSDVVIS